MNFTDEHWRLVAPRTSRAVHLRTAGMAPIRFYSFLYNY